MATVIEDKNFTNRPVGDIPKAGIYRRCNFSQDTCLTPGVGTAKGVRLFPDDDTPRVFENCNLMNCEPPPGSVVQGCNTWIKETGQPSSQTTDEVVEIDGEEISRKQFWEARVYGRYTNEGYVYKPSPDVFDEKLKTDKF